MVNSEVIKIEQENKTEAEFMSRSFIDKSVKNRAYINALGAELVVKYLSKNGIEIGELHSIHSISKVLEKVDISDILLPNIHIDTRIVFDEEDIFIPKSHFELGIKPDIYVFAKLNPDFESVELLGYLEAGKVTFDDSNEDYYFIKKDVLESVNSLVNYVKNFDSSREKALSDDDMLKGRELSVAMADHDISDADFKKLLSMLIVSDSLRNSLLEFDNFELLSYNAVAFVHQEQAAVIPEDISDADVDMQSGTEDDSESSSEYETYTTQEEDTVTQDDNIEVEEEISDISEDVDSISDFEEDFQSFGEEDKINEITESIDEEIVSEPLADDILNIEDTIQEEVENVEEIDADAIQNAFANNSKAETVSETSKDVDIDDNSGSNIAGTIASGAAAIAGGAAVGGAAMAATFGAAEAGTVAAAGAAANAAGGIVNSIGDAITDSVSNAVDMGSSAVTDEAIKLAGMANDVSEQVSESIDEELPDISLDDPDLELSEEVFDGDDTINGINEDFTDDGITLPDISDESADALDLNEQNNSENIYDDDIFTQFAQNSDGEQVQSDVIPTSPSEENMLSFAELEQMNQAPVSSAADEIFDGGISEIVEDAEPLAVENSTIISDKTFSVGEIPIDINVSSTAQEPMQGELGDIYNTDYSSNNSSMLNNNVRIIKNNPTQNTKNPLLAIIIALVVLAGIGFGAFQFLKPAKNEPIVDDYVPEDNHNVVPEDPNALQVDNNNVVEMDSKNMYATPAAAPGQGIVRQSKPIAATAYMKVSKVSWEVPDYVSYSPAFRQYFQSAGRSLKLALTSDLLLATEYAYSNQIKVSATFNKGGAFTGARIVQSSGSSEVDKIVLQTVNQTLNVLKAPESLRDDDSTTVILKIYF